MAPEGPEADVVKSWYAEAYIEAAAALTIAWWWDNPAVPDIDAQGGRGKCGDESAGPCIEENEGHSSDDRGRWGPE